MVLARMLLVGLSAQSPEGLRRGTQDMQRVESISIKCGGKIARIGKEPLAGMPEHKSKGVDDGFQ